MEVLYQNLLAVEFNQVIMWAIGGVLIYLAIAKDMEPTLLLPMGFGAILVNLPDSGAAAVIEHLFEIGIAGHKEFIGLSLLDLMYMEYVLYAMQLHYYGIDTTNIRHAINDLFHLNYAIK